MRTLFVGMLAGLAGVLLLPRVLGMAGDLDRPSLAFPTETPKALQSQILVALNAREAAFLRGRFINADTTLAYGGDTDALSVMLAQLAGCEGIRVKVSFVRVPGGESWTIRHNAWADATHIAVRVNVAAEKVDLLKLDLPAVGAKPGGEAAKPGPATAVPASNPTKLPVAGGAGMFRPN